MDHALDAAGHAHCARGSLLPLGRRRALEPPLLQPHGLLDRDGHVDLEGIATLNALIGLFALTALSRLSPCRIGSQLATFLPVGPR